MTKTKILLKEIDSLNCNNDYLKPNPNTPSHKKCK